MFCCFSSMEGCTYRFRVIFTVACPMNFTQAVDIKAEFNTACGKCMSQCMEIHRNQASLFLYIMEIFLHSAGFNIFFIYSGKNISLTVGKFLLNELDQTVWNWNCTDRTFAFGRCNHNTGFLCGGGIWNLQPLHCVVDMDRFFLK